MFVIILVGPDEKPFGIQKDFLCHKSEFYQKEFSTRVTEERVEHITKLPEATTEIFGLAQQFMYTESIIPDVNNIPSYEALVGLWGLGHKLGIKGLCEKTLEAMVDCRRLTERIPSTPLLIQVWRETPEGSSIRQLLLSWAAEYMRSSDARAQFAKSLPQEVLSELVVTMSSFDTTPTVQVAEPSPTDPSILPRKNVHYLEENSEDEASKNTKKNRRSSGFATGPLPLADAKPQLARKPPRTSLPKAPQRRRSSGMHLDARSFTTAQKLEFCSDLLTRMLSGPGMYLLFVYVHSG